MSAAVSCNLCGARDEKQLFNRPAPGGFGADGARMTTDVYGAYGRIVRCRRCGLVYTSPRPEAGALLDAYASMEDEDYLEERDSRAINAHLSLQIIRRHRSGGKLLDVGCSAGFLLNAARMDFEAQGLEPSRWAAGLARKRLGLTVTEGGLDDAAFPDGHFDVVTMVDVIEHLSDPAEALKRAARLLKPGGLLYLVTPDIESLSARLLGGWWWGLRPAHVYYFSRRTLNAMLEKAGFRTAECRSYGRLFTYGYWLSRLRHYPALFHRAAAAAVRLLGVAEKPVYINTRDSLEVCAVRDAAVPAPPSK